MLARDDRMHAHVGLVAGLGRDDQPVFELVPAEGASAFTFPVSVRFAAIESLLNGWTAAHDGASWSCANGYEDDSDKPLG